ncbi:Na+/H+ antiporter family protein [Paraferrimonas sedimenticola]
MLGLSLARINVVIALTISALAAGLVGGLDISATIDAFNQGLGGGAKIALSYAMLGAFAVSLSYSGLPDVIANALVKRVGGSEDHSGWVKSGLILVLVAMAVSSQNILPIHIAFIPILVPPLLMLMSQLQVDRRLIACVLTFGLVTTYMILPVGFGAIFLNDILLANLIDNGLQAQASDVPNAMLLPAAGMILGLLIAIFISYRAPRQYEIKQSQATKAKAEINQKGVIAALVAILVTLGVQLYTDSMIFGALMGFIVLNLSGALKHVESQELMVKGVAMMAMIGFIMIAAAGFAAVVKATGEVQTLVSSIADTIGDNKALAAFLMLLVGLLITMGIGSSFSTIPIIATIYVPLAATFGFSAAATIALVGTAAALGDAGSPASDSTLGPTAGLNADGQHDHIRDSVIPTFVHFNLPLLVFGWAAALVL